MGNRRLEQVHTKLWEIFGLSFLECEQKNDHYGHLSVLGSDSFFRLTEPPPPHRFGPLGISFKALGGQQSLHQFSMHWKANSPLQTARPDEQHRDTCPSRVKAYFCNFSIFELMKEVEPIRILGENLNVRL